MRPPATARGCRRTLALVLLAALAACVQDVHHIGPIAPAPRTRPAAVRALVFGDFGIRSIPQWLVARAIRRESAERPFDLAIQVGDNVYPCGPDPILPGAQSCRFAGDGASVLAGATPPDDPAFRANEEPLTGLLGRDGTPLPIYLALGNHDVGTGGRCAVPGLDAYETARRRACLAVARRTPTWSMPARHYVIDRGPVRLIVIDTNVAVADYAGFTLDEEIAFVRKATEPCRDARERAAQPQPAEPAARAERSAAERGDANGLRQCFLVGHHPPASVHGYGKGRSPPYAWRMARLVDAAGGRARAFFAGHVHTLEHLALGPLDVFVSGSTAMGSFHRFRYRWPSAAQVRFATSTWGYAILEADREGYRVRFVDTAGEALHCCAAGLVGPCRPVECR